MTNSISRVNSLGLYCTKYFARKFDTQEPGANKFFVISCLKQFLQIQKFTQQSALDNYFSSGNKFS